MVSIAYILGRQLKWVKSGLLAQDYALQADADVIATLEFKGMFSSHAVGESREGRWSFKRVGFLQTGVSVRTLGQENDIAMFRNNTWSGGGGLTLADGSSMQATTGMMQRHLEFKTSDDTPILRLETRSFFSESFPITIAAEAWDRPELPWLMMLACYLKIMMDRESATVTAG